ncbi:glyoxalase superfamily protein [Streptomyces sp. NPDC050504]|uniref:glyoxalase superfamily protein n=1 Tax=Streptomyces sp. NPDC050504 TaxID=3365618 RepID=UPI00379E5746
MPNRPEPAPSAPSAPGATGVGGAVRSNETTVPILPCVSPEETLDFYRALGFEVTYEMRKPYVYLVVEWSGFALHFSGVGVDPAAGGGGCCLVAVDAVAPYHAAFVAAMRRAYGKVLASGQPRITRYRAGASRFTLVDPSGNSLIFVERDEPMELEYGGSKELPPLARALDSARIYREFKDDDRAALRVLTSALRRHAGDAPLVDRALAVAESADLAAVLGEEERAAGLREELRELLPRLTEEERRRVEKAS